MATLHGYILRELLKTFALALAALTVIFTMGGGLVNIVKYEGVTTGDIFKLLPLMVPSVVTFLMPVAGLFAATMVYGRLAADNELTACRASGVNVHRLFGSAVLLSVFVTIFTVYFGNFVIPDFMKQLERFVRSNLRDIAAERLKLKGHVRYDHNQTRYFITASRLRDFSAEQLAQQGFDPALDYLYVEDPTFLQIESSNAVGRFITARFGLCQFDTRTTPMRMLLYVNDGWEYSPAGREVRIQQQVIGPIDVPVPMPIKPAMVDLPTLLRWERAPWEADDLAEKLRQFREKVTIARFYEEAIRTLNTGSTLTLYDAEQRRYELAAAEAAASSKGHPVLTAVRVQYGAEGEQRPTRYEAPRAELKAHAAPNGRFVIEMALARSAESPVHEYNPRSGDYSTPRPMDDLSVDGALVPTDMVAAVQAIPSPELLDPAAGPALGTELGDERIRLQREAARLQRKVSSVIHFRLGVAGSALVTLLMGAILGVMFRGARLLAAFGLAAIPFATVMIVIVMGRQLIENAGTERAGVAVIWLGLLCLAIGDFVLLRLGVRR
jgi:hypothetical protein